MSEMFQPLVRVSAAQNRSSGWPPTVRASRSCEACAPATTDRAASADRAASCSRRPVASRRSSRPTSTSRPWRPLATGSGSPRPAAELYGPLVAPRHVATVTAARRPTALFPRPDVPGLREALDLLAASGDLETVRRPVDPAGRSPPSLARLEEAGRCRPCASNWIEGWPGWSMPATSSPARESIARLLGVAPADLTEELGRRLAATDSSRGSWRTARSTRQCWRARSDARRRSARDPPRGRRGAVRLARASRSAATRDTGPAQRGCLPLHARRRAAPRAVADLHLGHRGHLPPLEERGQPLEVAIMPGVSPLLSLAAQLQGAPGHRRIRSCRRPRGTPARAGQGAARWTSRCRPTPRSSSRPASCPGSATTRRPSPDMSRSYSRVKRGRSPRSRPSPTAEAHPPDRVLRAPRCHEHGGGVPRGRDPGGRARWPAPACGASTCPASGYGFHCYLAIEKATTVEGRERGEQVNAMLAARGRRAPAQARHRLATMTSTSTATARCSRPWRAASRPWTRRPARTVSSSSARPGRHLRPLELPPRVPQRQAPRRRHAAQRPHARAARGHARGAHRGAWSDPPRGLPRGLTRDQLASRASPRPTARAEPSPRKERAGTWLTPTSSSAAGASSPRSGSTRATSRCARAAISAIGAPGSMPQGARTIDAVGPPRLPRHRRPPRPSADVREPLRRQHPHRDEVGGRGRLHDDHPHAPQPRVPTVSFFDNFPFYRAGRRGLRHHRRRLQRGRGHRPARLRPAAHGQRAGHQLVQVLHGLYAGRGLGVRHQRHERQADHRRPADDQGHGLPGR